MPKVRAISPVRPATSSWSSRARVRRARRTQWARQRQRPPPGPPANHSWSWRWGTCGTRSCSTAATHDSKL
jgi:hypothetical protein